MAYKLGKSDNIAFESFAIINFVRGVMRQKGMSKEEIEAFTQETTDWHKGGFLWVIKNSQAMYDKLIQTQK